MADIFHPDHGAIVAIGPFTVANLDTAKTDTDLVIGQAAITTVPMPGSGSILGLCANCTAAPSAGTATFHVHSSGTEISGGPAVALDSDNNTAGVVDRDSTARAHTFAAGAALGVSVSTSTDLAATTVDYNAWIFVRFDPGQTTA
jgi:hypothetical protein